MASLVTPRQFQHQMVHYLRKSITFADNGQTLDVGTIPAGSLIHKAASGVMVLTAFNGGTTNTADIGASTDSGTNNFGSALALGSAGFVPLDENTLLVSVDTKVVVYVVSTASASAGAAEVVIAYIPDNDL